MSNSTDLVPATNMAALEALDPHHQELAVTNMLSEARQWLAHAVEATEPRPAAQFKAMVATIAEHTKQLGLSREIQLDAQEMVRRAERGVGKAIRKGQDEGEVRKPREGGGYRSHAGVLPVDNGQYSPSSPSDFASSDELSGNGAGIYAMTDDITDEQFEEAVVAAKAEGNLARANVVRKAKGEEPKPTGRHELLHRTRHHDVARIFASVAMSLEGAAAGLNLIPRNENAITDDMCDEHADVINEALRTIRSFLRTEMSPR